MREIFYSFLVSCLIFTIYSCGKTTEENVNDTVSKTNENIDGIIEDNNDTVATDTGSDNPSIIYTKFIKEIIPIEEAQFSHKKTYKSIISSELPPLILHSQRASTISPPSCKTNQLMLCIVIT